MVPVNGAVFSCLGLIFHAIRNRVAALYVATLQLPCRRGTGLPCLWILGSVCHTRT